MQQVFPVRRDLLELNVKRRGGQRMGVIVGLETGRIVGGQRQTESR